MNVRDALISELEDGLLVFVLIRDIRLDDEQRCGDGLHNVAYFVASSVVDMEGEGHFSHVRCVVGNVETESVIDNDGLI